MKAQQIRENSPAELQKMLGDLRADLFQLRFQHAINQLDNPMRLHEVKKDIARVRTILTEIEMEAKNGIKKTVSVKTVKKSDENKETKPAKTAKPAAKPVVKEPPETETDAAEKAAVKPAKTTKTPAKPAAKAAAKKTVGATKPAVKKPATTVKKTVKTEAPEETTQEVTE